MDGNIQQHIRLDGITEYTGALDTLCHLAKHSLYLFEKNFDGLGFNTEARYETLRGFLLANPTNRLFMLAHDIRYLSTLCPRMKMLLEQFDGSMFIYQTPKHLQHITEPFGVADGIHYVRRFHFDDPRGIFAQHDPEKALGLKSQFMELWSASHQAISPTTLGL